MLRSYYWFQQRNESFLRPSPLILCRAVRGQTELQSNTLELLACPAQVTYMLYLYLKPFIKFNQWVSLQATMLCGNLPPVVTYNVGLHLYCFSCCLEKGIKWFLIPWITDENRAVAVWMGVFVLPQHFPQYSKTAQLLVTMTLFTCTKYSVFLPLFQRRQRCK